MRLDIRKKQIVISRYDENEIDIATRNYHAFEKANSNKGVDIVMVSAENFDALRESYQNYFIETKQFLNYLSKDFVEQKSIPFLVDKTSERINKYFISKYNKGNKDCRKRAYSNIGIIDTDTYFCADYPITLDKSYLRYSSIGIENIDEYNGYYNKVTGPALIALETGACYYIDGGKCKYVSLVGSIVIQCKTGVEKNSLLFLLAWLKSNVFTWDLIVNKKSNSINISNFNNLFMPKPTGKLYDSIIFEVTQVLDLEYDFIKKYNSALPVEQVDYEIDNFNENIRKHLIKIEDNFCKYYSIRKTWKNIMKKDIELKGYFSYR